jgi:hypothetical protein
MSDGASVVQRYVHELWNRGEVELVSEDLVRHAPLMGEQPTGRALATPCLSFFRLENGKVAEDWVSLDPLGLAQQMGALPNAAPA